MAVTGTVLAVGAVAGAGVQGYFSNKSSKAAAKAAAAAAAEMRRSKAEAIGYLAPYRQSGGLALSPLTGLLTGSQYDAKTGQTTQLNEDQRNDLFQKSPGYQFRVDQAMKNAQASQAARGGLLSGGAMKELSDHGSGMASDEFGSYIQQLMGLSGMGQNAATTSGNYAIGAGGQIANYEQQAGMAKANGYANQGNIYGNGISQLTTVGGLVAKDSQDQALGRGEYNPNNNPQMYGYPSGGSKF